MNWGEGLGTLEVWFCIIVLLDLECSRASQSEQGCHFALVLGLRGGTAYISVGCGKVIMCLGISFDRMYSY